MVPMDKPTQTKFSEVLTRIADTQGESLADLALSTGIDPANPDITLSQIDFLRFSYGADPEELLTAALASLKTAA